MGCRDGIAAAIGAGAFLVVGVGAASADQGGAAGNCGPPGQTIHIAAQVPDVSTPEAFGVAPGQAVSAECAPGHQGP